MLYDAGGKKHEIIRNTEECDERDAKTIAHCEGE
jgi:hypothetical protein